MTDMQKPEEHSPDQDKSLSHGEDHKGPEVRIPPPLVFILFLSAGFVLHLLLPIRITDSVPLLFLGVTLSMLAIIILISLGLMFHKHKTSIKPWEPTTRVLDHGPYAYSRNPIYVAFCFLVIGIGLTQNSLWMTLSFIPSVFVVFHTAIVKEEKYLEKKFGEEYRRYKEKVRRWL